MKKTSTSEKDVAIDKKSSSWLRKGAACICSIMNVRQTSSATTSCVMVPGWKGSRAKKPTSSIFLATSTISHQNHSGSYSLHRKASAFVISVCCERMSARRLRSSSTR